MRDPFPIPPPLWLQQATAPIAAQLSLPTLPLHIHEVILSFAMYQLIHSYISPFISSRLYPVRYNNFNKRTRINWDVHVVSLTQSLIVNTTALYLMFFDEERKDMNWAGRIWGYDGASGMLQGLAGGYFIWDLIITVRHIDIFGVGMLLHAMSAVTVFSLGFRPFLNYYGPVFVLYELSSPALNMHWFMDKLQLTGSIYQLINGILLISTFFFCRLVWGGINSVYVFRDVWAAMSHNALSAASSNSGLGNATAVAGDVLRTGLNEVKDTVSGGTGAPGHNVMQFAGSHSLPLWLALSYLASNIVLNALNYYWFAKMIGTLRKRFDPPLGTKGVGEEKEEVSHEKKELVEVGGLGEPSGLSSGLDEVEIQKGVFGDGRKTIEVSGRETRSRRRG